MRKTHDKLMRESYWYNRWHNNSAHPVTHWFFFLVVGLLLAGVLSDRLIQNQNSTETVTSNQAASLAATIAAKKSQPIPGQYIIQFKDDVKDPKGLAQQLANDHSGEIKHVYTKAIKGFSAKIPDVAINGLKNNPNIKLVEQDTTVQATELQTNLPSWGLDRIDQVNLPMDNSYTYNSTGIGVNAYVIDTGIRATHNEFAGRMGNGYSSINDGYGPTGCHWHGTHVAGTLGGKPTGGGGVGVAKGVTLHSVRVLDCNGSGSTADVIAGIDWVINNKITPAVANLSISGGFTQSLNDSIRNLVNSGVTAVVAAGNSASDACSYSPASEPLAITVGATDSTDIMASFSNYGRCVDVFAPGYSIFSATNDTDTSYARASGTSMATPHVAGIAALYLEKNPTATPAQVANEIITKSTSGAIRNLGAGSPNLLVNSLFSGAPVSTAPSNDIEAPSQPQNFVVTAPSSSSAKLSWSASTDNVGVIGYKVIRNAAVIANVSSTSYTDSSVTPGTTYVYNVAAYDAGGNTSANSTSKSVTIPTGTMPPPSTNVVDILSYSVSTTLSTATIKWTTNIPATGYVTYSSKNTTSQRKDDTNLTTDHTLILNSLKTNTNYNYTITAQANGSGDVVTGTFKTPRK